ncbi:ATP synthase F1 subunit epsilon [Pelagibacterales bacterium SAG-MED15]|nr:ATP synthase F1 subunit epsilon [Pelagibacterales bacterium SAG-MED15]
MSELFNLEIINPEKSFFTKDDVNEVVVPAYEGEMGILKDHISIISFLKPGIMKVFTSNSEEKFYIEDGILEFKDNSLSILTSSVIKYDQLDRDYIQKSIQEAEENLSKDDINDQQRFLISQKIDTLKSVIVN